MINIEDITNVEGIQKKKYVVYCAYDLDFDCCYIGMTKVYLSRIKAHVMRGGSYFSTKIKNRGNRLIWTIVEQFDDSTEAFYFETKMINKTFKSLKKWGGYNSSSNYGFYKYNNTFKMSPRKTLQEQHEDLEKLIANYNSYLD